MGESEAKRKWRKEKTTVVTCRLNNAIDAAILERLKKEPNVAGYIKLALSEKIERESQK